MGGVPALRVTPEVVHDGRTLLYLHGGAYIVGDPEGYRGLAAALADAVNAVIYLPDYRLAPEHSFPVPLDDVFTSYRWLLDQGVAPSDIALAGTRPAAR